MLVLSLLSLPWVPEVLLAVRRFGPFGGVGAEYASNTLTGNQSGERREGPLAPMQGILSLETAILNF